MKNNQRLFTFIMLISCFIESGCSTSTKNEAQSLQQSKMEEQMIVGHKIVVQKRVGDENKYEDRKEITNNEQVQKVKEILNVIDWENAKVEMVRPPDYTFYFPRQEVRGVLYGLWISPKEDTVQLVIFDESKYTQLDQNKSSELIEIITDSKI